MQKGKSDFVQEGNWIYIQAIVKDNDLLKT